MKIRGAYFASDVIADKIAGRGIAIEHIDEVFRKEPVIHVIGKGYSKRYLAWGNTGAGRHVFVVFAAAPEGRARIISARDMTDKEKKRHRKK